jgi:hypothetical protein
MSRKLNTDTFYSDMDIGISSEHYSIVVGFFKKVFETNNAAEAFAVDLFRIAKSTDVAVLTLLESMQDKDTIGVSEIMAFYLNQIRSQSALLGVSNVITPNPQVSRNILG